MPIANKHNLLELKHGHKMGSNIEKQCSSLLKNADLTHLMFVVGNHFMRTYYTVFDRDNHQIGLALANNH